MLCLSLASFGPFPAASCWVTAGHGPPAREAAIPGPSANGGTYRTWHGTRTRPRRRGWQATAAALTCVWCAWLGLRKLVMRCQGRSRLLTVDANAMEMAMIASSPPVI